MDDQTLFALMVDLYRDGERQGPGSRKETLRALQMTRIDPQAHLQIADIGCGSGAASLVLAAELPNARIIAIDIFSEFLQELSQRAARAGHSEKIVTLEKSMDSLSFAAESLDLIWSEGAIYNMGFSRGIEAWRHFLRTGGCLAVSEITWLRPDPPDDLRQYWMSQYSEIATAPEKIAILERAGYDLIGYFVEPGSCWVENYYTPTASRFDAFLDRHADVAEARELVAMERQEADLYRRFQDCYGYGFYVARKR